MHLAALEADEALGASLHRADEADDAGGDGAEHDQQQHDGEDDAGHFAVRYDVVVIVAMTSSATVVIVVVIVLPRLPVDAV